VIRHTRNGFNLLVSMIGFYLFGQIVFYGDPVPAGCLWIVLVSIKCLLDIFDI
jgi:hypothetical protein